MAEDEVAGSKVAGSPSELPKVIVSEARAELKRKVTPKVMEPLLAKSVQMYRAKILLAKGKRFIARGALTDLNWLDADGKQRLIRMGAVRKVVSPPLAELAGWKTRAKRLEPFGVKTMADFSVLPADKLAAILRVKKETVIGWQDQLREWSRLVEPPGR